jgi:chemotaxis protein CheX
VTRIISRKETHNMRAEFLNPFVTSLVRILEDVTDEKPMLDQQPFLRPGFHFTTETVAIIIGVTGHLSGQVILSISEDCARNIASIMLMESVIPELDEYAQSALAELTNMVVANATIGLCDAGYECDITPPTVITGRRMEIMCPKNIPTIAVPLKMKNGTIELNLSLVISKQYAVSHNEGNQN